MKIYLIGYMGCGKTTTGRKLSRKMKLTFIDLDEFIEEKMQMTIPEIFNEWGEKKFRQLEHNALKKIIRKDNFVLATGGGTPCFHRNMDAMKKSGIVVYLKLDSRILLKRLRKTTMHRPLLKNKQPVELLTFISAQVSKRERYYKKADITVDLSPAI